MPSDVTRDFSTAGGVAHVDCVFQVESFCESREIIGVGVHFVAIPRLSGTAVPAPVMRDDSKALLAEKQHLSVPVIGGERPAVTEHYGLALSPILVVNLCAVFCRDRRHEFFSSLNLFVPGTSAEQTVFRSSCTQSLRMKPNRCENGKGGENQQYQQLSNQEWRFFLCWGQGFQRRYLQERLDNQNEDIEVECGCGSHHVNRNRTLPQCLRFGCPIVLEGTGAESPGPNTERTAIPGCSAAGIADFRHPYRFRNGSVSPGATAYSLIGIQSVRRTFLEQTNSERRKIHFVFQAEDRIRDLLQGLG